MLLSLNNREAYFLAYHIPNTDTRIPVVAGSAIFVVGQETDRRQR